MIEETLSSSISSREELSRAIAHLGDLERVEVPESLQQDHPEFFSATLPFIQSLACEMPSLFSGPVPILEQNKEQTVALSQRQVGCLLAHMFFCTIPGPPAHPATLEMVPWRHDFSKWFLPENKMGPTKLRFLTNYFERIRSEMPRGNIVFQRQALDPTLQEGVWRDSSCLLQRVTARAEGVIEDACSDARQVDFANRCLGGGALNQGCVQEEIMFLTHPELNAGILFCPIMRDNEAIIMRGAECFSTSTGYARSLQFGTNFVDETPRDEDGVMRKEVVAIDALVFGQTSPQVQLHGEFIVRELNKAYIGFVDKSPAAADGRPPMPIATGNWGCGAFGGDKGVKSMIQWMAASQAKREMWYYSFGDGALAESLNRLSELAVSKSVTVGQLFSILESARTEITSDTSIKLLNFVEESLQKM